MRRLTGPCTDGHVSAGRLARTEDEVCGWPQTQPAGVKPIVPGWRVCSSRAVTVHPPLTSAIAIRKLKLSTVIPAWCICASLTHLASVRTNATVDLPAGSVQRPHETLTPEWDAP